MYQVDRCHFRRSIDLLAFVQCCQVAAGVWADGANALSRFLVVRELLSRFPLEATEPERLMAGVIFSRFALRLNPRPINFRTAAAITRPFSHR